MKKLVVFTVLAGASLAALAQQEQGRVLSSTPIVQQVAVPQQVCGNETVAVQQPKSGVGALLGAVAGGVVGNAIGHGGGRAAATALGVVGGAALGDSAEAPNQPYYQNVQRCGTQTTYQNRTVGYNVTYEYAGRQYTTQMANDPGSYIPIQVGPANAAPAQSYSSTTQGVYAEPGVVVGAYDPSSVVYAPAEPVYYPQSPYYYGVSPISFSIGLGYIGGGHRHWR
ncbi:glycine zipper 2TM domain-containing protein [Xylophilus sp.]|uniref:glycine zipper 2TM domain-containing protein n=1 Tax=Xylophilus sp. TaxID=2653893 RepID=UPI0013B8701B|nr:glycine zipper 2TM domain-containing protein [Xylophilus sp.]KAF1049489.1 MAG: hypothetical protein GAK38_00581 [Xylophilus sp.]